MKTRYVLGKVREDGSRIAWARRGSEIRYFLVFKNGHCYTSEVGSYKLTEVFRKAKQIAAQL